MSRECLYKTTKETYPKLSHFGVNTHCARVDVSFELEPRRFSKDFPKDVSIEYSKGITIKFSAEFHKNQLKIF